MASKTPYRIKAESVESCSCRHGCSRWCNRAAGAVYGSRGCLPLQLCEFCSLHQCSRASGKKKKVALVACMRKLLTILNAIIRDMQPWHASIATLQHSTQLLIVFLESKVVKSRFATPIYGRPTRAPCP